MIVKRGHLQVDVIIDEPHCFLLILITLRANLTLFRRNRLNFIPSPLMISNLLRQQPNQVLNLICLLPQRLLLLANIPMLCLEQDIRLLGILQKLLLLSDVLDEHRFDLQ